MISSGNHLLFGKIRGSNPTFPLPLTTSEGNRVVNIRKTTDEGIYIGDEVSISGFTKKDVRIVGLNLDDQKKPFATRLTRIYSRDGDIVLYSGKVGLFGGGAASSSSSKVIEPINFDIKIEGVGSCKMIFTTDEVNLTLMDSSGRTLPLDEITIGGRSIQDFKGIGERPHEFSGLENRYLPGFTIIGSRLQTYHEFGFLQYTYDSMQQSLDFTCTQQIPEDGRYDRLDKTVFELALTATSSEQFDVVLEQIKRIRCTSAAEYELVQMKMWFVFMLQTRIYKKGIFASGREITSRGEMMAENMHISFNLVNLGVVSFAGDYRLDYLICRGCVLYDLPRAYKYEKYAQLAMGDFKEINKDILKEDGLNSHSEKMRIKLVFAFLEYARLLEDLSAREQCLATASSILEKFPECNMLLKAKYQIIKNKCEDDKVKQSIEDRVAYERLGELIRIISQPEGIGMLEMERGVEPDFSEQLNIVDEQDRIFFDYLTANENGTAISSFDEVISKYGEICKSHDIESKFRAELRLTYINFIHKGGNPKELKVKMDKMLYSITQYPDLIQKKLKVELSFFRCLMFMYADEYNALVIEDFKNIQENFEEIYPKSLAADVKGFFNLNYARSLVLSNPAYAMILLKNVRDTVNCQTLRESAMSDLERLQGQKELAALTAS